MTHGRWGVLVLCGGMLGAACTSSSTDAIDGSTTSVDAAAFLDGTVVVWGDLSGDPSPTYLLDAEGRLTEAPPLPIYPGMGHLGSLVVGNRQVALSERPEVALFDLATQSWAVSELSAAWSGQADPDPAQVQWHGTLSSQLVWTGSEVLAWTGSTVARWAPPGSCPVSVPDDPPFEPPTPWPPVPGGERTAWIGTEHLWTLIDVGEHTPRTTRGS